MARLKEKQENRERRRETKSHKKWEDSERDKRNRWPTEGETDS